LKYHEKQSNATRKTGGMNGGPKKVEIFGNVQMCSHLEGHGTLFSGIEKLVAGLPSPALWPSRF
jgi:hypothetical protein